LPANPLRLAPETIIGIIGAGTCDEKTAALAEEVGGLVAKRGAAMVCGGLGGVMEAAARGAFKNGGRTIGILPGDDRRSANPYISLPMVTDMGHARNVVIARTAQGLVAIEGECGTLSEIAVALKIGKPVVALGKWKTIEGVVSAENAEEAVEKIFNLI